MNDFRNQTALKNKKIAYLTFNTGIISGSIDQNLIIENIPLEILNDKDYSAVEINKVLESTVSKDFFESKGLRDLESSEYSMNYVKRSQQETDRNIKNEEKKVTDSLYRRLLPSPP